ncbi:MAG TPA: four-helix bundle copper-binding protein [Gaiellaceae bacterium]|nr:four-helix bundle copper-binding protein [Gaiellaceae bacterium]
MAVALEMMRTHPLTRGDDEPLARGVEECVACAQACTACADACLAEDDVASLRSCIATTLDCADVCEATGRLLTRRTGADATVTRAQLLACIETCRQCAEECEAHASHHEHCRVCAQACRRCEQACEEALAAVPA